MALAEDITAAGPDTVPPLTVAVIGTGAIGQDLVGKIHRSPVLEVGLVAGRNPESAGLRHAARLGCPTTAGGIDAILAAPRPFDVVFDATNAMSHAEHWRLLEPLGTLLIDLTPSRTGQMVVPTVTGTPAGRNISLISCGGQASVPVAHALAGRFEVEYIEVVSTVASTVAGRATRLNLDEYVATTQHAVTAFSGVRDTKAILNISPAVPPAGFRTAVHAVVPGAAAAAGEVRAVVAEAAGRVRAFAPGYEVVACAVTGDRVVVSLEVTAHSDVLPGYAGNLDIIDSAAVLVAEQHAARLATAARTGVAR
ncbi:acetaldehyde dehydrogenase (acetylating) [Streptomyces sp. GC420]|uniref:acetaldehyde dehydrogenase (acetylating) n=1 Tax=Streptomyces sp. GC420 TaxID=2697568 RepID=UPI0014150C80|nr:acetaldehyde dehydrogenase (acetylating) [Streptomyces sp. GC420]NBM15825.1 acetaldehyde dehydrogenase (acetylating) [Streptomyces sp. GC420]